MPNHISAIVTLFELHFYRVLAYVIRFAAGISLHGEVNRIVTRLITGGDVVLRLQGSGLCDLKADRCVTLRPNQ
jgi:hypothetical protein